MKHGLSLILAVLIAGNVGATTLLCIAEEHVGYISKLTMSEINERKDEVREREGFSSGSETKFLVSESGVKFFGGGTLMDTCQTHPKKVHPYLCTNSEAPQLFFNIDGGLGFLAFITTMNDDKKIVHSLLFGRCSSIE